MYINLFLCIFFIGVSKFEFGRNNNGVGWTALVLSAINGAAAAAEIF